MSFFGILELFTLEQGAGARRTDRQTKSQTDAVRNAAF